jgi:hypothetical protein
MSQLLPSTGTPVDAELFGDHFSVGQYFGRAGGTALIVGITFPAPPPHYTAALPVAIEPEQADGRGPAQLEHLRAGFGRIDPNRSFGEFLWQQVASTTGDGALANGGPKARHTGTGLFNNVWRLPRPGDAIPVRAAAAPAWEEGLGVTLSSLVARPLAAEPAAAFHRARWDDFHKYSASGARAMKANAACQEFFRVLKALEAKFALGHGRNIDRAVSTYLGEKRLRLAAMCGHRKMGDFSGCLTRFLDKFRGVYMSLAVAQLHAMEGTPLITQCAFLVLLSLCFLFDYIAGPV